MKDTLAEVIARWRRLGRDLAVRKHCLECAGETTTDVTLCPCTACPLWGFRMGDILHNEKARKRFEECAERDPKAFEEAFKDIDEPVEIQTQGDSDEQT